MSSQRLSLSNSVFANRIKKFDVYQHDPNNSLRINPKAGSNNFHHSVNSSRHAERKNVPTIRSRSVITNLSATQKLALNVVSKSKSSAQSSFSNQFTAPLSQKKKHSKLQLAFYGFGLVIFLFAGGVSVQTLLVNKSAKDQIGVLGDKTGTLDSQGVAEGTGSDPAESVVTAQAVANYKTDPELPRVIRIPSLGVYARIKHTGTDNGAVDAPKNINDASWYNESARPGNAIGSSLLLGHVSGWTTAGVFKKIDQLKPGDRFEVEKGSGEKLTYEVTRGERIPLDKVDMSKILGTEVAGEHDMKLMTCSGKYNKETKQFEERYVVYAKILR